MKNLITSLCTCFLISGLTVSLSSDLHSANSEADETRKWEKATRLDGTTYNHCKNPGSTCKVKKKKGAI